ncbi:hypothetical protein SEA_ZITCH_5 [Gordonia Phage Zitch]|uniref:Uncharacterized protein n=1 Tax=Gordonia Phage Zitch TaxID=2743909 RepID=A0A7G3V924_9CAUD|nr:hypothetical protein J1774_gp05 [Gordonia Phage Zitch]QKY78452.1 hypothetical protein SEA_ZITCH_5 [Gordonia Phage Zitch]
MPRQQPPQYPPKRNASRQDWYLYAVNRCRYTDEMETMNRAELIALVEAQQPTPWPDVDDEVEHETIANGGRTKCPSCGMAYRNSLGHPAHCPPIGREIVEHLPEQIRPFSVRDAIQEHVMQGSPQHPAGQHPVDVFLNAAWTWLRDNIVAVWATILVIGAIVMVGANPAVGAVSIGIAAAVVLPIAIPLHRRHRRRQLLERMAQQHDLWMTDPTEYRRRVEEGEL